MAQTDIDPAGVTVLPTGFRGFLRRRVQEICGLLLLAVISAIAVSLASWSISDPSLNHAVDQSAQNYLGKAGAIIADLGIQTFGLATLITLIVPVFWAFHLIGHVNPGRVKSRIAAWPPAFILGAGFLSSVPSPKSWPLPTGLGGIAGDAISALVTTILGYLLYSPALAAFCGAALLAVTAAALLYFAAGKASSENIIHASPDSESQGADIAIRSLGALDHLRLSLRAFFVRIASRPVWLLSPLKNISQPLFDKITSPRLSRIKNWLTSLLENPQENEITRIEPHFGSQGPHAATAYTDHSYAHDGNDDEYYPDAGPYDEDNNGPYPAQASVRVGPAPHVIEQAKPRRQPRITRKYKLPPQALLTAPKSQGANPELAPRVLQENARALEGVLEDFGVRGEIINVNPGPVVTLYELEPAAGIKSSRVIGLADDIARSMSAISARVAVVPGRNAIGIELPNSKREIVYLRELLGSKEFSAIENGLPLALGKNIGGEPIMADLARMPHLLIAGTTGSGKSVGINTMILSLLYRLPPERCKLIMIDPKMLELSVYDDIPHLLAPVVTDPKKAVVALKWTVREMEDRYKKMSKIGVRNIDGFNERVSQANSSGEILSRTVQTGFDQNTGQPIYEQEDMDLEPMPYIVVIIDEMADLMMVAGKDIEGTVQRLAQMARAAGIHMITATQRPSVDVITGTIKANFPTRISFQVTSKIDSRTILGEMGAEQLLGQGDMLFMAGGGRISRVHGPFVSDAEVEAIVKHLKKQGHPEYLSAITEEPEEAEPGVVPDIEGGSGDDLYDQAVAIVGRDKKASTSYIQRRLSIGYNRAATIIERMEEEGIISPANHAGKREVLIGEPGEGVRA